MRGSVSDHVVAFWITVVRRAREFGRAVLVGFTLDSLYERYIIRYVLRNSLVGIGPFFSPQVFPHLQVLQDRFKEIRDEIVQEKVRIPMLHEIELTQT
ncbi:hypothetical protein T484DRAFT_1834089 [Baffinella frigidus]|nr:hypothetical protein T484DRAFT_1834089 [Cryptophyta sp. CCMP2293]